MKKTWQEGKLRLLGRSYFQLRNKNNFLIDCCDIDDTFKQRWDEDEEIFYLKSHMLQVLPGETKTYYFYRSKQEARIREFERQEKIKEAEERKKVYFQESHK